VPQGDLPTAGPIVGDPCGAGTLTASDTLVDSDGAGNLAFRAACGGVLGIFRIPAGGGPLVQVAALDDVTTAGPGFFFDDPSIQGSDASFSGTRAGIYRIHCSATACDPPTTIAQPLTAIPGLPGEDIATVYTEVLAGQGNLVGFQVTTRGGPFRRDALLASRAGVLELVTASGLIIPGTTAEVTDVFGNGLAAVASPLATDKRGIAFTVDFTDPNDLSASSGVYLTRSGVTTEIARTVSRRPAEAVRPVPTPLVKGTRVYFRATIADCFIRATGSVHTGLSCSGDTLRQSGHAPGPSEQTCRACGPWRCSHASLGGSFFGSVCSRRPRAAPRRSPAAATTLAARSTLVRVRHLSSARRWRDLARQRRTSSRASSSSARGQSPGSRRTISRRRRRRIPLLRSATVDRRPGGRVLSDVIGGTSPNALFLATLKR
jgi:hypothetical protein